MEKAPQQFRYRIAVHLDQPHVGLELGCRLFEDRRHCPARTAPGRPRNQPAAEMSLCFACLSNRATLSSAAGRPFIKRPMAGAALGAVAQSFARHTVDCVAMRADDVQRAGHLHSREAGCGRMMGRPGSRLDRHQLFGKAPPDKRSPAQSRPISAAPIAAATRQLTVINDLTDGSAYKRPHANAGKRNIHATRNHMHRSRYTCGFAGHRSGRPI